MRDVAAPLYRFFLADAQAAAREGDEAAMLECLGLALDFVPEEHRERVLVAAAQLFPAPPPAAVDPIPAAIAPPEPQVVLGAAPQIERLIWETPSAPPSFGVSALPAGNAQRARSLGPPVAAPSVVRRRRPILLSLLAVLTHAAAATVAVRAGVVEMPVPIGSLLPQGAPLDRARAALAAGRPEEAVSIITVLGPQGGPDASLLRAEAALLLHDTAAAADALSAAAEQDAGDGLRALEAGDRLSVLGLTRRAAEAYLYAATPERTPEEIQRIVHTLRRAGFPDRARRVLAASSD